LPLGRNYKSNLAVLKNFADASTFFFAPLVLHAVFFGLFIALMTLLFMFSSFFRSPFAFCQFYKQEPRGDGKVFPFCSNEATQQKKLCFALPGTMLETILRR
jgi:hypothetical protein